MNLYIFRSIYKLLDIKFLNESCRKLRRLVGFLFRSMYFVSSASWVKVKGKLASPKEAPILVTAPHSSFFDPLAVLLTGPASVVGKVEAGEIPFYGSK
jgi:1-acyl-sn-glycerol-3-phosphate acyltransferase